MTAETAQNVAVTSAWGPEITWSVRPSGTASGSELVSERDARRVEVANLTRLPKSLEMIYVEGFGYIEGPACHSLD